MSDLFEDEETGSDVGADEQPAAAAAAATATATTAVAVKAEAEGAIEAAPKAGASLEKEAVAVEEAAAGGGWNARGEFFSALCGEGGSADPGGPSRVSQIRFWDGYGR